MSEPRALGRAAGMRRWSIVGAPGSAALAPRRCGREYATIAHPGTKEATMKLSLEDAGPLFTVLVAASLGAALTFAAIDAGSRSTEAVVDLRFEFDARTYEVDRSIRVIRRPTRGLEGLVRDVESLREQQRVISELVRELPPPRP